MTTTVVSLVIPPHIVDVKNRSTYIKSVVSRIALNDFNEETYKQAKEIPAKDGLLTSVTLNDAQLKGLVAYQEKHGLSSRNQAILAILATHYAKQAVVEKVKPPSFKQAIFMIGARG